MIKVIKTNTEFATHNQAWTGLTMSILDNTTIGTDFKRYQCIFLNKEAPFIYFRQMENGEVSYND